MQNDFLLDLQIDEENLETEWLTQPSHYMKYAEAHADAIKVRDMMKMKMDTIHAELYLKIKGDWQKFFDSKPTVDEVKAKIETRKKYLEAYKAHVEATHKVNMMQNAKSAFEHRKKALENIVSLRITGFHSEPRNKTMDRRSHTEQKKMLNKGKRVTSRKTNQRKRKK